jgi:MFS superfamily sulfate permease-like transporter
MLAGIGVLILASQFHVMFDRQPESSGIKNLLAIPQTVYQSLGTVTFPGSTERGAQKEQIAAVRKLQRQQQVLRLNVLDRFKTGQPTADKLTAFAQEQTTIREKLMANSESLAQAYGSDTPRAAGLRTRIDAVATATRESEQTLKSGDPARISETLTSANQSMDALLGGVKNNLLAALIGVVTILSMVLWKGLAPQKLQLIPPALIAVIVGTGLAVVLVLPVLYVDVPASMADEIRLPNWSMLQAAPWGELISVALLMAVVASAETLLCCTAVDQVQSGPRTQYDKELIAQGIGNFLCGILGALPMTGVIVRSTANIQAGGKTRLSAILHGVWLLVFVVGLSWLLRMIPTACLAAVLVYTGFKLIDFKTMKTLKGFGWGELGIYLATVSVIVCKDLLSGVIVGFGLAIAKLLHKFSHLETRMDRAPDGSAILTVVGSATFVRLPQLAKVVESVPRGINVHINLEALDYIDHACFDLLMNWSKQHEAAGGEVTIDWKSLQLMVTETSPPVAKSPVAQG